MEGTCRRGSLLRPVMEDPRLGARGPEVVVVAEGPVDAEADGSEFEEIATLLDRLLRLLVDLIRVSLIRILELNPFYCAGPLYCVVHVKHVTYS